MLFTKILSFLENDLINILHLLCLIVSCILGYFLKPAVYLNQPLFEDPNTSPFTEFLPYIKSKIYTGYKLQVLLYSIVNLLQKSAIYCCRPRSEDSISTRFDVFQGPAFIYFRKRHAHFRVPSSPQEFNVSLRPIVYHSRYHLQFDCIQEKKSSPSPIIGSTPEFIDYSIPFAKLLLVTSVYFSLTNVCL